MAKYRNKRTGEIREVPDPPQAQAQAPAKPSNGAPEWANEAADTMKTWANAALMGLPATAFGEDMSETAAKHPIAATVGSVTSPLNKLMPGGVVGTALKAAGGANYAKSVGQNPYVGGLSAGAVSMAGNALSGGANLLGKLAPFLKSTFGEAIGKVGGTAGQAISKAAVPVSEAISNAQAMENEENRKRYREANGLEK